MKKTILLLLLFATILFSCKHSKQVPKPEMMQRGGELVAQIRGAYDATHATLIEIYYLDGYFHQYSTSYTRQTSDSMGMWCNSEEFGSWSKTGDNKMTVQVNDDNRFRVVIPFDPKLPFYYQTPGLWNKCCECNEPSKCCQAWPVGNLGFTCIPCESYGCTACISVSTDDDGIITGGPIYGFYDSRLTGTNFIQE